MKKPFGFLKRKKVEPLTRNNEWLKNNYFGKTEIPEGQEQRWKNEIYDTSMNPREWMARFGHNILCGDLRMFRYTDKELEKWIHSAFEALVNEGLEKLWAEFLNNEEIDQIKEDYENM